MQYFELRCIFNTFSYKVYLSRRNQPVAKNKNGGTLFTSACDYTFSLLASVFPASTSFLTAEMTTGFF